MSKSVVTLLDIKKTTPVRVCKARNV